MVKLDEKKELVHKIVFDISKYNNVVAVLLFGSQVNGKVKPISDIDIAVVIDKPYENDEFEAYSSKDIDVVIFKNFHLI